jgi:sec-independent protein translocase protein TatA
VPNIGPLEIIILLLVVLVIFGPKRLPELGRGLGRGMREFKDSITGKENDEPKELGASNTVQTSGQATAPPDEAARVQQQPPPTPAAAPAAPGQTEEAPEPETARSGESRG